MLEELQEIYKISTSCIDHVQNLTQFPFTTIERTMKEFGVSNHLVKKIRALKKEKGHLGEYSRILSPSLPRTPPFLFSQEIFCILRYAALCSLYDLETSCVSGS